MTDNPNNSESFHPLYLTRLAKAVEREYERIVKEGEQIPDVIYARVQTASDISAEYGVEINLSKREVREVEKVEIKGRERFIKKQGGLEMTMVLGQNDSPTPLELLGSVAQSIKDIREYSDTLMIFMQASGTGNEPDY